MQQPILNGILESPLDLNGFGFVNVGGVLGTFQAHSSVLDTLAATSPSFAGIDILQIANPGVDSYLTVDSNGVPSYVATGNTVSSTENTTVDGQVVLFNGTTGKVIRKSTATGIAKLASGVLSTVTAPTGDLVGHDDNQILYNKTLSLGTVVSNIGLNFERPSGAGIIQFLAPGGSSSLFCYLPSTSGTLITSAEVSDGYVPTTRTVNGHALSSNVTVTPTDLGLVIGTNVQAYSSSLAAFASITPSERVIDFIADPTLVKLKAAITDETTVGWNLLTLANPSAITFPRLNADNTVTTLNAADFRTATGAGTVTSVSVTTANGISGSVANATTTPAITLSLGAITPISVVAPNDTDMLVRGGSHTAGPTFLGASLTLGAADPSTHLANVILTPVAGGSVIISSLTSDGLLKTSGGTGTVGVASMGAGVETALSVAVGSIGSFITHNGALGTPISGTLTNATGLPISGISGLASGIGTFLATPTLANLKSAVTDETTVGWNLLTLANPSATAFLRINSDNTVSAVDASEFRDELSLVIGTNVQAYSANLTTWAGTTLDTDGTLAANSDAKVASQKAVKTYVTAHTVTNSAGADVVPKSDGTNLVASSITDDGVAVNVTADSLRVNGDEVILSSSAVQAANVQGTSSNDDATAYKLGQYVIASVVQGSATALTTATPKTVTSISLTSGDWDVTAIGCLTGASTGTEFDVAIGTTNNSMTGTVLGNSRCQTPTVSLAGADASLMIPSFRVSLASTTTIYLIVQETFTLGSPAAYGRISARRVR